MMRVVLLVALAAALGCGGNNPLRVPIPKATSTARDAAAPDAGALDGPDAAGLLEAGAVDAGALEASAVDASADANAAAALCKTPGRAARSATLDDGSCAQGAEVRDGVCACPTSPPKVCDGRCVDLETDEDNCGACGCRCGPTQTCNGGLCGRAPQLVVPATPDCAPLSLATGGGLLIWADRLHGTVSAMAAGGPVMTIAAGEDGPAHVTFVGGAVYWMTDTAIRQGGVGAPPTTVARSAQPIRGFAVRGTSIFYATRLAVVHQPPPPAAAIELAHDDGVPTALALDEPNGGLVYQTAEPAQIGIVAVGGGGVDRVPGGRGPLLLPTLVAGGGRVLWADGDLVRTARTSRPFASAIVASTLLAGPIAGLAVSGDTVYFSAPGAGGLDGVVYKALVAPGETSIPIARGLRDPRAVVVDDERVYWSTGDCAIMAKGL